MGKDIFGWNFTTFYIYVPFNSIESYKKALPKYNDKIQRIP